ncbi:cx9C motif-containing protein 4 [Tachysurus fulvidraco]|uniref:cx9C motif-containing protein 4 n=1 Tax=Tachysurus fulvidraco TaxID=1234273 RepID=UPI001FEDD00C|nr:cx9C motif-containing protein 4 [Tachysurus fulvidraco]
MKDPCQKQACDIQKCLQANNYSESRCEDVIRAMMKCCEAQKGKDSVCCAGFTQGHKTTADKTQDGVEVRRSEKVEEHGVSCTEP